MAQTAPGSIVVGVDGSSGADQALDWAADQAAAEHRPLTLLHGVDPVAFAGSGDYPGAGVDYAGLEEEIRRDDAGTLERASDRVRERHSGLQVHCVTSEADPRRALLDVSTQAAMVVLGSRGRGPVASLLLGSVGVAVSRHASCPVVVLRPGDRTGRGVLVGVDGTAQSLPAVELAYRMASLHGWELTVMHCFHDVVHAPAAADPTSLDVGEELTLVSESVAGMAEKFPDVTQHVRIVPGHPAPELLRASGAFELLVVGHQRRTRLGGLLHDPVASTVVEHALVPVAVVPSG